MKVNVYILMVLVPFFFLLSDIAFAVRCGDGICHTDAGESWETCSHGGYNQFISLYI